MRNLDTVVVGYDGSGDARRAVEAAADLTAAGGTVHVVVAYKPLSSAETAHLWHELPEEFKSTFDPLVAPRNHLADAEALVTARGVAVTGHVVDDQPATAILETADAVDADLVVVGSRGLGRAARFLRGSVSTRVAGNSHRNVLIVHADDDG